MSQIRTFFRSCPSCGKRFEIRLTGEKLLESETLTDEVPTTQPSRGFMPSTYLPLEQNVPLTVEEEEFEYAYECKHCGHKWVEVVHKEEE